MREMVRTRCATEGLGLKTQGRIRKTSGHDHTDEGDHNSNYIYSVAARQMRQGRH